MSTLARLTIADLELLPAPNDDTRYELIDGELYVSTQPHFNHGVVGPGRPTRSRDASAGGHLRAG